MGVVPKIVSLSESMESVLMAIEAGIGVSILPRCVEGCASTSLRSVDLDEDITIDVILAWVRKNKNPVISMLIREC